MHAPGPWVYRDAPYGYDIFVSDITTDRALWVASITTGLLGMESPFYPTKDACAANARLIAAAPDLFEYVASSASAGCATAQALIDRIAVSAGDRIP